MAREEGKEKHTGRKVVGAAVILALLGGGGYFGFGIGNPNGGFLPVNGTTAVQQQTQAETPAPSTQEITQAPTEATSLKITVQESKILYQGKEVTIAELETQLLKDFKEGKEITLTDDHAIKAVYDEVEALLGRLNLKFQKQ